MINRGESDRRDIDHHVHDGGRMTGYAARRPYPGRTTYVTAVEVEVTGRDNGTPCAWSVTSTPVPLHRALITRAGRLGMYVVTFPTVLMGPTYRYAVESDALKAAGDLVGRKAGADWQRFNGPQRYALGQQKCPYLVASGTCDQAPEVGTVWCLWHPQGRKVKE